MLGQESVVYFNMKHFHDQVVAGEWDEVERYLSGFTKPDDDPYSMKIFFEIRKQKYLEALDRNDETQAFQVLVRELRAFLAVTEEVYKEFAQLRDFRNFRRNKQFWLYGDIQDARNILFNEIKKIIEANPLFRDRLNFPPVEDSSTVAMNLLDDLPMTVVWTKRLPSSVTSIDFHPRHPSLVLVGTNVGEITIWEVGSCIRIAHQAFKLWHASRCRQFQAGRNKVVKISVNKCIWSPDGSIIGIAFSRYVVQTYAFDTNGQLMRQLGFDAHYGRVNDISFAQPEKSLLFITCGNDKMIKVWDAMTGQMKYVFIGLEAPVYSICHHSRWKCQLFSNTTDGEIIVWQYDSEESVVDFAATPGNWSITMAYSADGSRLFSCGSSDDGETHLAEWNKSKRFIIRVYSGLKKRPRGALQFDTTRNRYLAVGDEHKIKFWDVDKGNILATTDAEGGLPDSPRLKFNKYGSLIAVTTKNGMKILASVDGQYLLRRLEARSIEIFRVASRKINTKPSILKALGGDVGGSEPGDAGPSDRTLMADQSIGED